MDASHEYARIEREIELCRTAFDALAAYVALMQRLGLDLFAERLALQIMQNDLSRLTHRLGAALVGSKDSVKKPPAEG